MCKYCVCSSNGIKFPNRDADYVYKAYQTSSEKDYIHIWVHENVVYKLIVNFYGKTQLGSGTMYSVSNNAIKFLEKQSKHNEQAKNILAEITLLY